MSYGFDPQRRVVWLDAETLDAPLGGALCAEHADAMILPLGWWLDDRRVGQGSLFKPAPALPAVPRRASPRTAAGRASSGAPEARLSESGTDEAAVVQTRRRRRAHRPRIGDVPLLPLDELFEVARQTDQGTSRSPALPGLALVSTIDAEREIDDDAAADQPDSSEPGDSGEADGIEPAAAATGDVETGNPVVPWMPFFRADDDLGGLLDARTPLLARAFGHRPGAHEADRQRKADARRVIPRAPRRLG